MNNNIKHIIFRLAASAYSNWNAVPVEVTGATAKSYAEVIIEGEKEWLEKSQIKEVSFDKSLTEGRYLYEKSRDYRMDVKLSGYICKDKSYGLLYGLEKKDDNGLYSFVEASKLTKISE